MVRKFVGNDVSCIRRIERYNDKILLRLSSWPSSTLVDVSFVVENLPLVVSGLCNGCCRSTCSCDEMDDIVSVASDRRMLNCRRQIRSMLGLSMDVVTLDVIINIDCVVIAPTRSRTKLIWYWWTVDSLSIVCGSNRVSWKTYRYSIRHSVVMCSCSCHVNVSVTCFRRTSMTRLTLYQLNKYEVGIMSLSISHTNGSWVEKPDDLNPRTNQIVCCYTS